MTKPKLRILRMGQTEDTVGMGRTQIRELEARGLFPKSVPMTKRTSGYLEHEVNDWIEGRVALRHLGSEHLLKNDPVLNADLSRGDADNGDEDEGEAA